MGLGLGWPHVPVCLGWHQSTLTRPVEVRRKERQHLGIKKKKKKKKIEAKICGFCYACYMFAEWVCSGIYLCQNMVKRWVRETERAWSDRDEEKIKWHYRIVWFKTLYLDFRKIRLKILYRVDWSRETGSRKGRRKNIEIIKVCGK